MKARTSGFAGLRTTVEDVLKSDAFAERISELLEVSTRRVVNPVLSFLFSPDEIVKWRAVTALGAIVAKMAQEDMEGARVIMRRLIWSLNDESGGIGWGSAEAMGEIMANHGRLAEEYSAILISYIRQDGNPLENELLDRGVLWGIGRLAKARPHMVQHATVHLAVYLSSHDPVHRGLAAWALGFLAAGAVRKHLEPLLDDSSTVRVYENGRFTDFEIRELAARTFQNG